MPWRRLLLALLLPACPATQQTPPPPPPTIDDGPDEPAARDGHAEPEPAVQPPSTSASTSPSTSPSTAPAFSDPNAQRSLADTLPPPEPRALPGGCEGGTRRPGETWKVDCNECSCGADGQSSCTAMACMPQPTR